MYLIVCRAKDAAKSTRHTRPSTPRCKSNLLNRLLDLLLFVGDPAPQDFTQLVKPYRL